jgi:transposase
MGSPDLNPIEQLFAKIKVLLRKAAARTIDALIVRNCRRPYQSQCSRMRKLPRKSGRSLPNMKML